MLLGLSPFPSCFQRTTPRVCRSGKLHFLVRFSRVDRLVVNCIAYGVEDSNIAQHWEFWFFYLFFHICFGWKTPQKQVIHGKGGAVANARHFGNYRAERPAQTPARILDGDGIRGGKTILPKLAFCVLDISTPSLTKYQKLPTQAELHWSYLVARDCIMNCQSDRLEDIVLGGLPPIVQDMASPPVAPCTSIAIFPL